METQISNLQPADITTVGNLIRIQRERLGMTQLELSEKARLGEKTISRLEQGKASMRIDTFFALAASLCVTPNDISPARYTAIYKDVRFSNLEAQYNMLSENRKQFVYDVLRSLVNGFLKLSE